MMENTVPEIFGNTRVTEALDKVARSPSLGHAYLFSGPEGIGKRLAALWFARVINCRCEKASEPCESCRLARQMNHPEMLMFEDANKPRWLRPADIAGTFADSGEGWINGFQNAVQSLAENGYIEEPLPRVKAGVGVIGFNITTDHLFGKGSVPSKECYTPKPISDRIRKAYDAGNLSEEEYVLLRRLYEYPLSVVPYRGTIPIAYITTRQNWQFTRPVQTFLNVRTMLGGKKVVIIDDAHKMTDQAQNCLLKTLEEPPPDSVIILVTSDRRRLFPTIVSRCQIIGFGRLSRPEMDQAIKHLMGRKTRDIEFVTSLAENSPGKLLALMMTDIESRLENVSRFFSAISEGRLESVFGFSRSVLEDGTRHRKKLQEVAKQALELALFWMVQILHVKRGVAGAASVAEYMNTIGSHAEKFGEAALIEASGHIEQSLPVADLNVDMTLYLQATLLRTATILLGSEPEN